MNSDIKGPVNIGNPEELTIENLARIIIKKIDPDLKIIYKPCPEDDPIKRKPVIEKANKELNWSPSTSLEDGLNKTIDYFKNIK